MQHYHWVPNYPPGTGQSLQEDPSQDVTYYYDTNPLLANFSQNTWGRLTAVTFGGIANAFYGATDPGTGDETDYYMVLAPAYM